MAEIARPERCCDEVPLAEQVGSLIALLDRELQRDEETRFRTAPLTAAQFSVAEALEAAGSLGAGELASAICCVPANVTALVDRLERKGYVERAAAAGDRRVRRLCLTTAGREALGETRRRVGARYARLDALPDLRLRALVEALGPLYLEVSRSGSTCAAPVAAVDPDTSGRVGA